ncbi:hypothetical protein BLNAU_4347 [Blattamonas nauphoetae]|uniref:Protein kinase domain-containing protein n=1 Tax=Blattamonas nauphoetae TaxID=2049346 RepID=A0ABQ9YA94_9EUKA|nr:hypothetical protein BLNAU_4347 [Blattamonas nauphoetae]
MLPILSILLQFCVILSHTILSLNSEAGTTRLPNLASIFDEQFVEPSQNSYNPSNSVYLSEYKYQGANVLIADRTFSLASQSSATIIFADNSKTASTTTTLSSMPTKNAKPASILVLQNSTVSLQHLSFIIHHDMNAIQNKNAACALLTESHLTSSNCVLISNKFKSTSGQIPSITCIDSDTDQPITLDTSVVSLTLESVEVATAKTVFNNVSSSRSFERATNGLTIRQQMHQTRLTNVDNALDGTILSDLSNSLYSGVVNSTFIDCMNEEESHVGERYRRKVTVIKLCLASRQGKDRRGVTQLYDSHFASISLTDTAAIQITGSASLETFIVTFNYISRASGNGGSCIDSTTTGHINMTMTDARHCRSTGRAGCYDFEDLTSKAKVSLMDCLFIFNLANINPDGTVATPGMKFGHDYATTGLLTGNVIKDTATVRTRSSLNYHVLTNTTQSNLFYANVHYYGYATPMPFGERSAYGVHLADFTGFQNILDQMLKGTTQTVLRFTLASGTSIPFDPIEVTGQNLQIHQPTVYPIDYTKPLALITSGTLYLYSINIQMQQEFSVPIIQVLNTNTKFQTYALTFTANEFHVSRVPFVTSVNGTLSHTQIRFRPEALTFEGCSMYELQGGAVTLTQWLVNNIHSTVNGAIVNCVGTNITVSQGTFKQITAPNGAVFHVEMTEYNTIQATHTATTAYTETFTQCTAIGDGTVEAPTGKGGVFYIKGTSSAKIPLKFNSTDKNHARFENNKAGHGNDIYIEKTLYTDSQIAELTGFGGNSLSAYYRVVFEGKEDLEDKKEMERLNFFLEIPVISVNGTGTDSTDCKWTSSYCKTLGWGITLLHFRFKNQTHMPQTIQYLYNATFTEKAIVVEDQSVTVRGSTAVRLNESKLSRTKITIDSKITAGSSLIEVGLNGSVHFTNLDLVPNTKASLLHVSSVSRGASMENVGIMLTSGQTYQYSLIITENQPITIENTLINTTAATLAILLEPFLTVTTDADTPVAMKNVTFENLNMKTESILQIQSAGSITLDEVKFKNSTRTTGEDGLYVRINADNLRRQIKPAFWPDSFVGTQAQKDFFGTDEFLKIKLDKNGGEASTHPNCGSDRFVCSTLDSGYRSAEANEMDQVELFSDTSLAKTMTLAIPIQMRSSSESVVRKVTQEGQSGIIVSLEAPERASLFHMIFTFSGTPIDNFISVESGSLYLFKTTFGTATQQTLASSLHTLARVKTGSTLSLEETTFQNLAFSHESLGSAIFVENGGILSADRGSLFSGLTSAGKGVHLYLISSDLSTQTEETPYTLFKSTLPLQTGTIFTRAQRNMFFGEMEGVTGSLLYYWYPHTAHEDTLSVTTEGDDHVVCGIPELPCASFDHGFRSLKKSGTRIIVSSSSSVKSALTTEFETVVIEGDVSTRILTFTNAGSMRVNEGQTYTLQSLCMEIEDGTRTEAVIAVTGTVVTNGISFGKTTPVTINTPLVEVTSGSFSLSSTTIKNIATSNSKSLFVLSSGNLGLTQIGFTWEGQAPRILSQSAGSSVVSGCTFTIGGEGSTLASSNLLEVSGGTLQLSDLTLDCTQKQISSLVALNGGQATLSKLLISNSILTSSLVAGSGALSITDSTFSSQVDSSFSSNSASSTISFTVPSGKSLTLGDGSKPFSFQNCKSSSDGGAIVLEVENEGSATLNLVTFTSCESGGAGGGMKATVKTGGTLTITQTSFTECSSTSEGGALNVIVVGTGKVSIDGTFKKCESKSNGGALLLDASSLGSSGSFVLNSIVFGTNSNEMNKAGTGFKGHNLFIKTPAGNHASINASSLTGSYLTLPANSNIFTEFETQQYTFCETNGAPTSILYLFNAYEGGELIVDETNGMDHELCGHPRLPCSSLSQSLGNLKGQDMVASLDTDITLTTSTSSTKLSAVEPRSNGRKTITISENVTITIVSSTLTLTSLEFAVNAALFSQSAVSITGGSLNVDDCVFDSISSSHSGAAISGTIQNGQSLTVTSSSFLTCVSEGDGGAVVFEVESEGSATLKLVTFTSCESGGAGGGMKATVKTGGELSITQTSFTGCSSTAEGGAMLIDASSIGSTGSFLLDSIVYDTGPSEMNQAGTGFKGHNLFIKTPAGNHASINASSLTGSYLTLPANSNIFTESETEQYTFCETNGAPTSILYLFNAYEGGELIVDETNGMDHELCGHPRLPCSSLPQSLGNMKGQDMLASLDTDITLTKSASSTKLSTIGHHSNDRRIVTISENVTITVVSSTLTLSSLEFAVSAALFSQSAVSITGGSLNVDNCVFDSISSSHSGAAISGTIQNGQSLTVTSSSFLTCVSEGDGGAISVECGDQVEADSLIIKATFTDCLCGEESKGSDVYVVGHDLARVIRKENWEGYPPEWNDTTENVVWGEDKQKIGTQFESLPLLFYLIPFFNITITTGSSGSDADGCGSSRLLCQTFSLAHSHLKGEGSHTFIVASSTDLDEIEVFQPNDITVRSESNTALLTVKKEGALHFDFDVGTSFNARVVDLVFKIDSEDVDPLIVSKNALLSISTCQFNKEGSYARSIVELVSGTFSLSSTSFSGATFDVPAFLLSTFTSASIDSLSVTSCTVSEFIVAKSGEKLTLENANFTSYSSSPQPEQNSDDSVCSWTTGLLKFENTATTLKNCSFNGWTQGSVNQIGGSLTLSEVSFTNGNASSEFSSSINRNVHCEANGKVDVVSLQAGSDGTDTQPSAWIDAKKCEITSTTKIHKSSLFIPKLDSTKSSSDHHYKNNTAKIALYGTLLLPCDLVLEVFEWDNKTTNAELNSTTLNLSSIPTTNWTEDLINFTLNFTEKLKVLDSKYEWRGRLVYGMGAKTENWVKIKASAADIRKSQSTDTMKWLIPLIIGLSLLFLLLFFIILIICLRRRKKNKEDEKPEALPMLSAAEMPEEMFQSDNDADKDKPSLDFDENDNKPAVIPAAAIPPKEEPDAEEEEKEIDDLEDFEEAMACDGTGQLKPVNKNKTLYKVLHGPKKSDDTDINDLQNQLLTGLTYVAGSDPSSKILTMLSPHSVLLEGNKVFLAIPKEEEKSGKAPRKKRGEDGHEAQRWEAPEITDHVPDSSGEKAAVFSLGLILLEFQTGQVPFGHMDAAVATRQLGAGILPDMDGVSEELTEIIQQCVLSNPDERPTLTEVQEVLKAE